MSLLLTPLQQSWLQEIHVAKPFLAPYIKASKPKAVSQSQPIATKPKPADLLKPLAPATSPKAVEKTITPIMEIDSSALSKMNLSQLQSYAEQCQGCALHEGRSKVVWGAGQTEQPEWFVVSTAPSSHEELSGLPMQGKSGELFDAQMQSIGVNAKQQLYLTQLLKCRPAEVKADAAHVAACQAILFRQIELIQPQRLLLLGSKAAAVFFGAEASVDSLRGQLHHWQGLPVVVSYHPSSLLLRPQLKAKAWEDLLCMQQSMQNV